MLIGILNMGFMITYACDDIVFAAQALCLFVPAAYSCCACFVAGEPGGGGICGVAWMRRRGVAGVRKRRGGGQRCVCRRRAAVGDVPPLFAIHTPHHRCHTSPRRLRALLFVFVRPDISNVEVRIEHFHILFINQYGTFFFSQHTLSGWKRIDL